MLEHLTAVLDAGRAVAALAPAAVAIMSATPTPPPDTGGTTPSAPAGLSVEDVSPGVAGFIATAAVVAAGIVVIRSMVGRLRGVRHRAEVEAREEAERARVLALDGAHPAGTPDDPGPAGLLGPGEGDGPVPHPAERPEHLE